MSETEHEVRVKAVKSDKSDKSTLTDECAESHDTLKIVWGVFRL